MRRMFPKFPVFIRKENVCQWFTKWYIFSQTNIGAFFEDFIQCFLEAANAAMFHTKEKNLGNNLCKQEYILLIACFQGKQLLQSQNPWLN